MSHWNEKTPDEVRKRYDRLASAYGVFEWIGGVRFSGIRWQAVEALRLHEGCTVLELGCGDGRNFALMQERIGRTGAIYGVDVSSEMLAAAEQRCQRGGWGNVHLTHGDAQSFDFGSSPLNAVLFCFSYSTMRDRLEILAKSLEWLSPGGRVVIADAGFLNQGPMRRALGIWASDKTLLGNPDTQPWSDLAALGGSSVETKRISTVGRQDVICTATKSGP